MREHFKYINLCSKDRQKSYRFGMTLDFLCEPRMMTLQIKQLQSWFEFCNEKHRHKWFT